MQIKNKNGFTFIEMIISISIVILLAVIANSTISKYSEKSNNSKVVSDLSTLDNSLTSYSQETSTLPMAWWNDNYFKIDTSYSHSWEDPDTFWAHWFITESTLPKKYLNYLPLDPITKQYYWYGRTKDSLELEIAWVIITDWEPQSVVNWNYSAEVWPYNLIREYNWPNFVYNKSKDNFPYNPNERVLTARIDDFSWLAWSVIINDTISDPTSLLSYTLKSWDKITVWTWSTADLYFSDWTKSTIWDPNQESELILSSMAFEWENNLITKIKLVLWAWTIWNKATDLWSDSEFEIYTSDASAAVRWTIFWVNKESTNTSNIIVQEWKVEVQEVQKEEIASNAETDYITDEILTDTLNEIINSDSFNNADYLTWTTTEIIVEEWETISWITYDFTTTEMTTGGGMDNTMIYTSTHTTITDSDTLTFVNHDFIENTPTLSNTMRINILSYYQNNSNTEIQVELNDTYRDQADFLKISWGFENTIQNNWSHESSLFLTWSSLQTGNWDTITWTIKIAFCKNKLDGTTVCTTAKEIELIDNDYSAESIEAANFEITQECAHWKQRFNDECIENNIWSDWQIVAYAPYDTDHNMYKSNWTTLTSSFSWSFHDWWVKISATNDYLVYSWSELNLTNDFAVEMSVKGEALNRIVSSQLEKYTLFDFWGDSDLFLQLSKLWTEYDFLDDHYYKVLHINDRGLRIKWNWINIHYSWNWNVFKANNVEINIIWNEGDIWFWNWELLIWKSNSSIGPYYWNSIIDYVKIYRKD